MRKLLLSFIILLSGTISPAQTQKYKACTIAFYNLENFYDTIHNPLINDDDFTPQGIKHYNSSIYFDKIEKLASVISRIATDITPLGPALLGVAEIENDTVLNDLIHHPSLQNRQYRFIHYSSKDPRGIDVALIYQPAYFLPQKAETIFVPLPGNRKKAFYTRDILYVKGQLAGETIHLYINHWPSRRGGEEISSSARETAAAVCRKHISAILEKEFDAKIILMGDLNDDPDSPGITHILQAKSSINETHPKDLFNPWSEPYHQGIGTIANRDSWGLFDQILLSQAWLSKRQQGFFYHHASIFSLPFMRENSGKFKNYPKRTWDGNSYHGGYSDHFPTYIVLLKALK